MSEKGKKGIQAIKSVVSKGAASVDVDALKAKAHKASEAIGGKAQEAKSALSTQLIGVKEKAGLTKEVLMEKLDQNGDGVFDIVDVIMLAIKTPGVYVNRAAFLQKEFFKNHPQNVIDDAITYTPALAGISSEEIDKIADEVIRFERTCVSGISAALGVPGGWAMAATIPADLAQYYGYTLRAVQKLLYLYGFPEIDGDEEGLQLDSETINEIIVCLGVMNGAAGANNAIKGMAQALSKGVEKKLMSMALTKGNIYPLVKAVMSWFNVRLTKTVFSEAVGKAIPVVGGFVAGGITFMSFKPCCMRLKAALQDTMLSNPDHVASTEENAFADGILSGEIIDLDYEPLESIEEYSAT